MSLSDTHATPIRRILGIARAGRVCDRAIEAVREAARPGVRVATLFEVAARVIRDAGARSAALGFEDAHSDRPFPSPIVLSINDQIAGGHDPDRAIESGDLITADAPICFEGWHADASDSWVVGGTHASRGRLAEGARAVCGTGVRTAAAGTPWDTVVNAMSAAAQRLGLVVCRGFSGHAVGAQLHEPPTLAMHAADLSPDRGTGLVLEPGMVLAIEPVLADRDSGFVRNGWVDRTADGSDAAFAEATVLIGKSRNLVLAGRCWCPRRHDLCPREA